MTVSNDVPPGASSEAPAAQDAPPPDSMQAASSAFEAAPADTGATSLSILLSLLDLSRSPEQLRREAGAGADPLDTIDLLGLCRTLGLRAARRRIAWDKLAATPLPALARWADAPVGDAAGTVANDGSAGFFVLAKVGPDKVLIHDPITNRPLTLSRAEFEARWAGKAGAKGELVLVARRAGAPEERRHFDLTWFLPPLVKHRALIGNVVVASLLLQVFALTTPLFLMVVTDKVLAAGQVSTLDVLVAGLVLAALFEWLVGSVRGLLTAHTSNRVDAELAAAMFRHLASLPVAYFSARPVGAVAGRLKDLDAIRAFLTGSAATLVIDLAFTFVFLAVMASYSVDLTLVVLGVMAGILGLHFVAAPILRARLQKNSKQSTESQTFLVEAVSGMETVKSLAIEPLLQRRWEEQVAAQVGAAHHAERMAGGINQAVSALNRLMIVAVLWLGAREVIDGSMSAGQMMAFYMMAGRALAPVQRLAGIAQQWHQARVSLGRVGEVMNAQPEPRRAGGASLPPLKGEVRFEGVSFRYGDGPEVLHGIDVTVRPGEVVGIVGSSGSGKSTFAKLIQRLHVPSSGKVRVDGTDLALIDAALLRAQVGMVLQDNFLFNLSARENIALAAPHLSMEQVAAAADLAGAHAFIMALPQGYDTKLGERGAILSAGQRQRIALARALAANPRILVLDEATSALDYESERRIHDNMKRITAGRTTFVIAHRLAILRDCDRILVIEGGKLVEEGPPAALLARAGRYAQLHAHQVGPVLKDVSQGAAE